MKRFCFNIFIVFFLFLVGGINLSLASLKIGCIDMQKAIQLTSLGQEAGQTLEKEYKKKQTEINQARESIKQKEQDISKQAPVLSKKALEKKRKSLQDQVREFQDMVQANTLQIQKKERELFSPIIEQFGEIIGKIAKDENYTIIFERSRQNVLWVNEAVDLTERVAKVFESEKSNSKKKKR